MPFKCVKPHADCFPWYHDNLRSNSDFICTCSLRDFEPKSEGFSLERCDDQMTVLTGEHYHITAVYFQLDSDPKIHLVFQMYCSSLNLFRGIKY